MSFSSVNLFSSIRSPFSQLNAGSIIPIILQKRVTAVALVVIAGLAIIFSIYLYFARNRKNASFIDSRESRIDIKPKDNSTSRLEQPEYRKAHSPPGDQSHLPPLTQQQNVNQLSIARKELEKILPSGLSNDREEFCQVNFETVVKIFNDPAQAHLREACRDFFWKSFKTEDWCDTYWRDLHVGENPGLIQVDELKTLIKEWSVEETKDETVFYHHLLCLLEAIEISQAKELLVYFPLETAIDIEKLITALKYFLSPPEGIVPYLYGAQILEILRSDKKNESHEPPKTLADKIAKLMSDSLKSSDRDFDKDDYCNLAAFLTENCASADLPILIRSFLNVKDKTDNNPGYHLTESLLLTLLNQNPKNLEKIRIAFNEYWTCWKSFDRGSPPCSLVILPAIKSEGVLKAIMPTHHVIKIVEIIRLLREPTIHQSKTYKLSLPQKVINGNVPPLEFEDYLNYLQEAFEECKDEKFDWQAAHQFEVMFKGFSVEQIEGFTQFLLGDLYDDLSDDEDASVNPDLRSSGASREPRVDEPWPLLQFLIINAFASNTQENRAKIDKILEIALPGLADAAVLEELFQLLGNPVGKRISIAQAKELIQYWQRQKPQNLTQVDNARWEENFFTTIMQLLKALDREKAKTIIDNFSADFTINLPEEVVEEIIPAIKE